ncbi:serum response factor-like isoform X2 [Cynoglossus semilaevis]|uniref:serum response factor-like isoform X2 n=1 Tax=Cynoglossus semilaevis TaxID=244447 RepID=UPI000D6266A3|nr:serum response factor-like isoform X2 [Cynoglossus semilaevis]
MGTRTGSGRAGNGAGVNNLSVETPGPGQGARFEETEILYSSDQDSESGDEEGSGGERRGVKRERSDREVRHPSASSSVGQGGGRVGVGAGVPGAKPGKKTRGRVKIKMEFIDNKLRRYTTFSKRKTGIMKKAYELSTLTGTQVLLLVASETGHVYTFATRKLQPMITSETGKALIQTCLNSPDSPPRSDPSTDQRMSATGFEETDLTYQVTEGDGCAEVTKDVAKQTQTISSTSSSSLSTVSMPVQTSNPTWQQSSSSTNGTVLKTSAGVVLPAGFTFMPGGGVSQQLQTVQVQSSSLASSNHSSSDIHISTSSSASLPPSMTSPTSSSNSVAGHMMYPGGHTVMYATPTSSIGDGSLTVLNTFPTTGHAQSHDPGTVQQVFLTSLPPVATQIPVSTVQLHQMVISQPSSSSNLTELQVVSLDVHQSKDD